MMDPAAFKTSGLDKPALLALHKAILIVMEDAGGEMTASGVAERFQGLAPGLIGDCLTALTYSDEIVRTSSLGERGRYKFLINKTDPGKLQKFDDLVDVIKGGEKRLREPSSDFYSPERIKSRETAQQQRRENEKKDKPADDPKPIAQEKVVPIKPDSKQECLDEKSIKNGNVEISQSSLPGTQEKTAALESAPVEVLRLELPVPGKLPFIALIPSNFDSGDFLLVWRMLELYLMRWNKFTDPRYVADKLAIAEFAIDRAELISNCDRDKEGQLHGAMKDEYLRAIALGGRFLKEAEMAIKIK